MNKTIQYALHIQCSGAINGSVALTSSFRSSIHADAIRYFALVSGPIHPNQRRFHHFHEHFYLLIASLIIPSLSLAGFAFYVFGFFSIQLFALHSSFSGFAWHRRYAQQLEKDQMLMASKRHFQHSSCWMHKQMKVSDVVQVRKHLIRVKFISYSEIKCSSWCKPSICQST